MWYLNAFKNIINENFKLSSKDSEMLDKKFKEHIKQLEKATEHNVYSQSKELPINAVINAMNTFKKRIEIEKNLHKEKISTERIDNLFVISLISALKVTFENAHLFDFVRAIFDDKDPNII